MKKHRIVAGLLLACFLMAVSAFSSEARGKQEKDHSLKIEQAGLVANHSFDLHAVTVLPQTVVIEPSPVVKVYPVYLVCSTSYFESAHVASALRCRGPTRKRC